MPRCAEGSPIAPPKICPRIVGSRFWAVGGYRAARGQLNSIVEFPPRLSAIGFRPQLRKSSSLRLISSFPRSFPSDSFRAADSRATTPAARWPAPAPDGQRRARSAVAKQVKILFAGIPADSDLFIIGAPPPPPTAAPPSARSAPRSAARVPNAPLAIRDGRSEEARREGRAGVREGVRGRGVQSAHRSCVWGGGV